MKKQKRTKSDMTLTPLQVLILYILKFAKEQGIENLSKFQIMKLVYMVEVESRKFLGESFIQGIRFQRGENGPISVDIYHAINSLIGKYIVRNETSTNGYRYKRSCHSIINANKIKFPLTEEQMIYLNCVLSDYIHLSQKELKKQAYATESMKYIVDKEATMKKNLRGNNLDMDMIPLDEDIAQSIIDSDKSYETL